MVKSLSELLYFFNSDSDTQIVTLDDRFYRIPKFNINGAPDSVSPIENTKELKSFFPILLLKQPVLLRFLLSALSRIGSLNC